jgi:hypothetical protein
LNSPPKLQPFEFQTPVDAAMDAIEESNAVDKELMSRQVKLHHL